MIAMPKRSVTRFFIPLIDVLLLLFCIFLLMPLANEEDLKKSQESSQNLTEDVESLERELQARLFASDDAREGITAFLEKRPANFKNKVSADMPDYFPWWDEPEYE